MKTPSKLGAIGTVLLSMMMAGPIAAAGKVADNDITYWVRDALRNDERVDGSRITVTTENGIVTLSGNLDNLAAKNYADMEAKKIRGVLGVLNKLVVEPTWRSDTDIRYAVRRRILNSALIESGGIRVASVDGKVTLSGEVASWTERDEAGLLASEVRGVKEVQNGITIQWSKTRRSDQEIKDDVVATLERDVYLSGLPITVSVKDGVVTLTGSVGSGYEKDRARSHVPWMDSIKDVRNELKVERWEDRGVRSHKLYPSDDELKRAVRDQLDQDTRVDASEMTVRASYGHVTLDGSVNGHYQKRIAEQDANDVVGVGRVTNNLVVRVESREDWLIQDDVDFNLNTDYTLEGLGIKTSVKDGVVTLSGKVYTLYQKSHAKDVAARVRGVKKVVDRLTADWSPGKKSDAELVSVIKSRLEWNWMTSSVANNIQVSVKNGVAILTGDVDSWSERREAWRVAYHTDGVWNVDNRLTVKGYDYPWDEWHYSGPYEYDPHYDKYYGSDDDYPPYPWLG